MRTVTADGTASETTVVPGRRLWIRSAGPDRIRLGRFGEGATAATSGTTSSRPTGYLIPPDRSRRPWRIGFEGIGKVEVCPAIPAK